MWFEYQDLEGGGNDLGVEKVILGGFKLGCGKIVIMFKSILTEVLGTDSLKDRREVGRL